MESPSPCPGIEKFVRPNVEFFKCPHCGGEVELWSDEDVGKCYTCGKDVPKASKELSCLEYCEYADKCKLLINKLKPPTDLPSV